MKKPDDAPKYISLRVDGALEIKSAFKRDFDGDFQILISCVEDNILDDVVIDWPAVERDYRESLKMKEEKESRNAGRPF